MTLLPFCFSRFTVGETDAGAEGRDSNMNLVPPATPDPFRPPRGRHSSAGAREPPPSPFGDPLRRNSVGGVSPVGALR